MGIVEEVEKLVEDAKARLVELKKGITILKEAGEDVADREAEAKALEERIRGLVAGLEKVKTGT